jgi:hypothetical protein
MVDHQVSVGEANMRKSNPSMVFISLFVIKSLHQLVKEVCKCHKFTTENNPNPELLTYFLRSNYPSISGRGN